MTEAPAIKHPKTENGGGLRVLALLNLAIAIIISLVIFLLATMAASGNAGFEPAMGVAMLGALYAGGGTIYGMMRTWRDAPGKALTLFFQFSWVVTLGIFILALFLSGQA